MNCHRLCSLVFSLLLAFTAHAAPKPNFVIIFIDDMGYADLGCFGATKQKTPNIDRMAAEGMRFTDFYASHLCSSSRAQIQTGCYSVRVSIRDVLGPASKEGLNPAEFTIAKRLKPLGYATQAVGKWHLGDQPEFLPQAHGYDHYFGIPYSNDMLRRSAARGVNVVPLVRDGEVVDLISDSEEQRPLVERYTDEAVAFIRANKDRPFFLYLAHNAVHTPIWPGKKFMGTSQNGRFGDLVQEVDWSAGRVLDTLRELGLDGNTLVIFSSDNGPWALKGADAGSAFPLRGAKGSTWEGGARVPTLAWWPGTVPKGAVCKTPAATIDLLPTLVKLAGGDLPDTPAIDGGDLSGLLTATSAEAPREAHYYFNAWKLEAVRQDPWKLALVPQRERIRNEDIPDDAKANPRLYNLVDDMGERVNLADKHPDIVARLKALADAKAAELCAPDAPGRRPCGVVERKAQMLYPGGEEAAQPRPVAPAQPLAALTPGDAVNGDRAPYVAGQPFTLACDVETAQKNTILLAHGGQAYGYALYLRTGHLTFAVRTGKGGVAEIVVPDPFPGKGRLEAALAKDGAMRLSLDGKLIAVGQAPGLIAQQPGEDFCVGHDNGQPVTAYTTPEPFNGRITQISVK
ncbi:MAG: sulfatase [Kiritimatiellaeota bacterium]|nr:sulfatase [Kiritimatiellota bacterium]